MNWKSAPMPLRWLALFAGIGVVAAALGALFRIGPGNGIFLAGAGTLVASLYFLRLGGPKTMVGRDIDGRPRWGLDPEKRGDEIRRGLFVFSVAMALWGVLILAFAFGVTW